MNSEFKLPFDTYDFFGYLLPGTLFSLGLGLVFWDKIGCYVESYIPKACSDIASQACSKVEVDGAVAVLFALVAVVTLYFLGHIVGCIAHLIYDRMIVRNILRYPYYNVLNIDKHIDSSSRIMRCTFIATGLVIIISPVFSHYALNEEFWKGLGKIATDFWREHFILGIVVCISIILSIITIVKRMLNVYEENKKKEIYLGNGCFERFCLILSRFFCRLTSTHIEVNKVLQKRFWDRLKKESGLTKEILEGDDGGYNSDVYWVSYIGLVKQSCSCHEGKIGNWLDMYGCLRNFSCAFLVTSVAASMRMWKTLFFPVPEFNFKWYTLVLIVSLFLSFILFMRYWIMYCAYYSEYIIRAYAVDDEISSAEEDS